MRLKKIIKIDGIMHCDTGLRIGGSSDSMEIGGLDNPIIRHPLTDLPYVPGSSIKGKLRSLLENVYGRRTRQERNNHQRSSDNGEPCGCGQTNCNICRVFGAHRNTRHRLGPTRLIVRDAKLTPESEETLKNAQVEKGIFYSEIKTENIIDRNSGTAKHPRTIERIPEGTTFQFEMSLKIFDIDREEEVVNFVKQGLNLLQSDYLGGSGSRGYGKISFHGLNFQEEDINNLIDVEKE